MFARCSVTILIDSTMTAFANGYRERKTAQYVGRLCLTHITDHLQLHLSHQSGSRFVFRESTKCICIYPIMLQKFSVCSSPKYFRHDSNWLNIGRGGTYYTAPIKTNQTNGTKYEIDKKRKIESIEFLTYDYKIFNLIKVSCWSGYF